jgi:protein-tyrosine phosphatase
MHQITDRLFVGNIYDSAQPPAQIGALLLVAEEYQLEAPSWLISSRIPFKDFGEADPNVLADAVSWVERHIADNRVMVCCRAGMGRSVSVAMAYLCCVEGMAYADVLKMVLAKRPGALPLPKLEEGIEQVRLLRQPA